MAVLFELSTLLSDILGRSLDSNLTLTLSFHSFSFAFLF